MSAKTWMAEFMPVPIENLKTMKEMCDAVRLKWEGAKQENLKKHNMIKAPSETFIIERGIWLDRVHMSGTNCAWCYTARGDCNNCPAVKAGMDPCSRLDDSPWTKWFRKGDPQPMIDWVDLAIHSLEIDHGFTQKIQTVQRDKQNQG